MIKKISSPMEPLTRELAQRFCNMRSLPGERPKRPSRLKYFNSLLRDGKFPFPNWSQALVANDPEPWRGDGQHTSDVLAHCDEKLFPPDWQVTINTYHLDSIDEDAAKFFDYFDNPRSARTNGDKLSIYVAHYPEMQPLDRIFLGKVLAGIHYFNKELNKQAVEAGRVPVLLPPQRDIGLYLGLTKDREFVLWTQRFADTTHEWMIGKEGIVAEIYNNWKLNPYVAANFWDEVFNESNQDSEDETREMIRIFLDWNHRTPATTQEKFRSRAKKTWDRYRKNSPSPATETVPLITPPSNPQLEACP